MTAARREFVAIPTVYGGVQMRSRLEARWAAVFDLAGWAWSYEPTDMDGWIPDFMLIGRRDVLCEVKPIRSPIEVTYEIEKIWRALLRTPAIETPEVLLLGLEGAAWLREVNHPVPDIGHGALDPWRVGWGEACIGRLPDGRLDFWHFWGSPEPRMQEYDTADRLTAAGLAALWREAGNKVQWRAPKS